MWDPANPVKATSKFSHFRTMGAAFDRVSRAAFVLTDNCIGTSFSLHSDAALCTTSRMRLAIVPVCSRSARTS